MKVYFDLDEHLETFENEMASPSSPLSRSTSRQQVPSTLQLLPLEIQEALEAIPPRANVDHYVAAFFNCGEPNTGNIAASFASELEQRLTTCSDRSRTYIPIPGIFHVLRCLANFSPLTQEPVQYQAFWTGTEEGSVTWLALLMAICSVGAEIQGQGTGNSTIQQHADVFRYQTTRLVGNFGWSPRQPHLIEALTLHVLSYLLKHQDVTLQAWQLFGHAVRLCYQGGYHRDPGQTARHTPFQCEMRRRTWIVVQELEIGMSCNAGMVNFINPLISNARPPSNVSDDDLSSTTDSISARSREDLTLVQVQISYWEMHSLLSECAMRGQRISRPQEQEISALCQRLDETKSLLPARLKWKPLEDCIVDPPMHIAHRLRIEMSYQKARCLLYLPYLRQPRNDNEQILGDRSLSSALEIVNRSIEVLSATSPGSRLSDAKVLVARHIHDFNLAAMLLCQHLKRGNTTHAQRPVGGMYTDQIRWMLRQSCDHWARMDNLSQRSRFALSAVQAFLSESPTSQQLPAVTENQSADFVIVDDDQNQAMDYFDWFPYGAVSAWNQNSDLDQAALYSSEHSGWPSCLFPSENVQ
jgi:hypothetical protein